MKFYRVRTGANEFWFPISVIFRISLGNVRRPMNLRSNADDNK